MNQAFKLVLLSLLLVSCAHNGENSTRDRVPTRWFWVLLHLPSSNGEVHVLTPQDSFEKFTHTEKMQLETDLCAPVTLSIPLEVFTKKSVVYVVVPRNEAMSAKIGPFAEEFLDRHASMIDGEYVIKITGPEFAGISLFHLIEYFIENGYSCRWWSYEHDRIVVKKCASITTERPSPDLFMSGQGENRREELSH